MAGTQDRAPTPRATAILEAARSLFLARGYAGVSIDEIGGALGMSGPAVYRHFRGKGALLDAIVREDVAALEAVAARDAPAEAVDALVALALEGGRIAGVLGNDLRHLPEPDRTALRDRVDGSVARLGRALGADERSSRLRARPLIAVAGSTSSYAPALPPEPLQETLTRAMHAVVAFGPLAPEDPRPPAASIVRDWLPRDEAVLAALPDLLRTRGSLDAVTMEDLGAAAGLTGPSVYTYFTGKRDVALRAAERAMSWATASLQQAMAFSSDGPDVMRRALRDYVELTARVPIFAAPLDLGAGTFDEATRARIEAFVGRYREQWTTCARIARPDLEPAAAEVLLWAAHAVVNSARIAVDGIADDVLLDLATSVFTA